VEQSLFNIKLHQLNNEGIEILNKKLILLVQNITILIQNIILVLYQDSCN